MGEVVDGLCRLERAGQLSEGFRIFSIAWVGFTFTLMVTGVIATLYYRQYLVYLQKRSILKTFLAFFALTAGLVAGPLDRTVAGRESNIHSCPVINISLMVTIPLYVLAGLSQVILFRNKHKFYESLGKTTPVGSEASSRVSYFQGFDASLRRKQLFANEGFIDVCVVIITLVFTGLVVGITSTMCPEFGKEEVCEYAEIANYKVAAVLFPMLALALLISVYIHRKLKTFPDPFNLIGEVKSGFFYGIVTAIPGFVLAFLNFGDPNGQEEVPFSYSVWIDAVLVLVFIYLVHWQIYKAKKFDEVQLLYRDITLAKVLKDKVGRDLFKLHLINEFSLENLLFIETIQKFRESAPENIEKSGQKIYDLFFREEILNIKYLTEKAVKETFQQGTITIDMYDTAYTEVYQLISRDSFARFQLSADFETYVGLQQVGTSFREKESSV